MHPNECDIESLGANCSLDTNFYFLETLLLRGFTDLCGILAALCTYAFGFCRRHVSFESCQSSFLSTVSGALRLSKPNIVSKGMQTHQTKRKSCLGRLSYNLPTQHYWEAEPKIVVSACSEPYPSNLPAASLFSESNPPPVGLRKVRAVPGGSGPRSIVPCNLTSHLAGNLTSHLAGNLTSHLAGNLTSHKGRYAVCVGSTPQVVDLGIQLYIWVASGSPKLGNISLSTPVPAGSASVPPSTVLLRVCLSCALIS